MKTLPKRDIAIRLSQKFPAPRERVFRAWTDPEVLRRWWCPQGFTPEVTEIDLRVGGRYRIGMRGPDGILVTVFGSFIEVAVPEYLTYTWQWENAFPGLPQTRVRVQFREVAGETEVTLVHQGFPEISRCLEHHYGWRRAWPRIAAAIKEAQCK